MKAIGALTVCAMASVDALRIAINHLPRFDVTALDKRIGLGIAHWRGADKAMSGWGRAKADNAASCPVGSNVNVLFVSGLDQSGLAILPWLPHVTCVAGLDVLFSTNAKPHSFADITDFIDRYTDKDTIILSESFGCLSAKEVAHKSKGCIYLNPPLGFERSPLKSILYEIADTGECTKAQLTVLQSMVARSSPDPKDLKENIKQMSDSGHLLLLIETLATLGINWGSHMNGDPRNEVVELAKKFKQAHDSSRPSWTDAPKSTFIISMHDTLIPSMPEANKLTEIGKSKDTTTVCYVDCGHAITSNLIQMDSVIQDLVGRGEITGKKGRYNVVKGGQKPLGFNDL